MKVRNLTPVTEDHEKEDLTGSIPDGPRPLGDGSKLANRGRDRDGHGDGSQSPLPPTPTSNPSLPIISNSPVTTPVSVPTSPHFTSELASLANLVRRQSEEIEKLRKEIRQRPMQVQSNQNQNMTGIHKDMNAKFDRLANEIKLFQRNMHSQMT